MKMLLVQGATARPAEIASLDNWKDFEVTIAVTPQRAEWINRELKNHLTKVKIIPLKARRCVPIPGMINQPLRDGVTLTGLEEVIKATDIVMTYTLSSYLSFNSSILVKKHNKFLVTEVWETFFSPWLTTPPYCWWYQEVIKNTDLFLARTKRSELLLKKLGISRDKITQHYPAPSPRFFFPAQKTQDQNDGSLNILYCGQLAESKGVRTLIRAFKKIQSQLPKAKLQISGFGPLEKWVDQEAIRNNQIDFIGNIPYPAIGNIYRGSAVFCSPDQHLTIAGVKIWEEMVPWTFREAAACGVPVITGSWLAHEGLADKAIACGMVSNQEERINCLAQTLCLVLENKSLRKNLASKLLSWSNENLNARKEADTLKKHLCL